MTSLRFREVTVLGVTALMLIAVASTEARPARQGLRQGADTVTRRYDVQLWMKGYTGLIETAECRAITDPAGYDSLVGIVTGIESTRPSNEPVLYTGVLQRKTKIDYCLALNTGFCVAKLTGEARMTVEIELREDQGAGAWMKADPVGPASSVSVTGNCAPQEMQQIRAEYPGGESAGTPDGQAIEESATNLFTVNGIRRFRAGLFPPNAVEGGWGMRVLRVLP